MDSKPPFRVTRRQFVTTSAAAMAAGSCHGHFASLRLPEQRNRDSRVSELNADLSA